MLRVQLGEELVERPADEFSGEPTHPVVAAASAAVTKMADAMPILATVMACGAMPATAVRAARLNPVLSLDGAARERGAEACQPRSDH